MTFRNGAARRASAEVRLASLTPQCCGPIRERQTKAVLRCKQQRDVRAVPQHAVSPDALLASASDVSDSDSSSASDAPAVLGIVIVDHGSKKAEANDMLNQFTEMFKAGGEHQIVEMAHMELAEPTIRQAVHKCADQGANHIVIAPYFLSNGRHVQEDIPALAQEAVADLPGVEVSIANPIGIDPLMAQLMGKRVQDAASKFAS